MQCVSDRFLRRSEQSDLQHSSLRVYTWINMWLSMTGQSSKSHFNATCKLSNKLITPGYCHVCVQLCVCVFALRNKCVHIAVMNLCMSVGAFVCESRFISVWAWVFVHDWLLCLSDHNWKEIHLSLCLSLLPPPCSLSLSFSLSPSVTGCLYLLSSTLRGALAACRVCVEANRHNILQSRACCWKARWILHWPAVLSCFPLAFFFPHLD